MIERKQSLRVLFCDEAKSGNDRGLLSLNKEEALHLHELAVDLETFGPEPEFRCFVVSLHFEVFVMPICSKRNLHVIASMKQGEAELYVHAIVRLGFEDAKRAARRIVCGDRQYLTVATWEAT